MDREVGPSQLGRHRAAHYVSPQVFDTGGVQEANSSRTLSQAPSSISACYIPVPSARMYESDLPDEKAQVRIGFERTDHLRLTDSITANCERLSGHNVRCWISRLDGRYNLENINFVGFGYQSLTAA